MSSFVTTRPPAPSLVLPMPGMPIHFPRLTRSDAKVVVHRVLRGLEDSTRTLEIVEAADILAREQVRALLTSGIFDTEEGQALLRDRSYLSDIDPDWMRSLPESTLGGALARFLDENGLSLGFFRQQTPYPDDELGSYLMIRLREIHDVWHVLTELGSAPHEEVLLLALSVAQTGLPASMMIITLGAIKHMVLEGRWNMLRHEIRHAYQMGLKAEPLIPVYWERYLEMPLTEVRERFGIGVYASEPCAR